MLEINKHIIREYGGKIISSLEIILQNHRVVFIPEFSIATDELERVLREYPWKEIKVEEVC